MAHLLFLAEDTATNEPSKTEDAKEQAKNDKLMMCTVSIVCSCGKDPTSTAGQKCQSFGHTATLILALSTTKEHTTSKDTVNSDTEDTSCLTAESELCPYILVYDILTAKNEASTKLLFNVDSSLELEKEMMLQDPYTPSGSEDDWMYDQLPVLPPDTLHSSVLQKFAEAIACDENSEKEKAKKPKGETNKLTKLVQCLELSGVCKGQHNKISEIVPFGDGQNLLVNFVCYSACGNKTELASNGENCRNTFSKTVEMSSDSPTVPSENHKHELSRDHSFTQTTFAVYRIATCNGERTLSWQPTRTKQFSSSQGVFSNIVALPVGSHDLLGDTSAQFQEREAERSSPSQLLVAAANGKVVVIDANSLNVLTKFTAGNEILHVLNCPGMDCFCACTTDGVMHFLGLRNQLPGETDLGTSEHDRMDGTSEVYSGGSFSQPGTVNEKLATNVEMTDVVNSMPF